MKLNDLKRFAQGARRKLMAEVASRLDYVLGYDDEYVRAHGADIAEIRRQLEKKSRVQLIEEVAYTWFNRIVAFRYMDLRGYHKVRVVSPQTGQVQPELLFQIKQGRTPPEVRSLQGMFDGILNGSIASSQPDREIYTAALLGICNDYSRTLPFLFRAVDEYMAVLLPTDLLSESSIISAVQGAIGDDDVADVEVIGWLYQFYISEKKDEVFGRPKGEKIKKEDIPAATQLFTPHWIVRYMVENSLGRLWRNNRPDTGLAERMEYYIEGDPEPEFLKIDGPEEITLLDPACGSGHILTYAFDLLYGMYEEAGYSAEEIPSLILTNNLYGIDIDTRAAELASFALTMKAREKDRFFFKRGVVPRVIAMEDVSVDLREAGITMSPQLQEAFGYLTEATNFGSLIPVPAEVQGEIEEQLAELDTKGDADLFTDQAIAQVRSGLRQLGYLARRYHCVVTNPPYMGSKGMNETLSRLLSNAIPEGRGDLMAAFMLTGINQTLRTGTMSAVTLDGWMFLSGYLDLRTEMLNGNSIKNLLHVGWNCFPYGHVYNRGVTFCVKVGAHGEHGRYMNLSDLPAATNKEEWFRDNRDSLKVFDRRTEDFLAIPEIPVAYWVSTNTIDRFRSIPPLRASFHVKQGLATADDNRFLRFWYEVSFDNTAMSNSGKRWIPFTKGGDFKKWYGNHNWVVNWDNDGSDIRGFVDNNGRQKSRPQNLSFYFRTGITWSLIATRGASFRVLPEGFIFGHKGPALFSRGNASINDGLSYLNSAVAAHYLKAISPTLGFEIGHVQRIPFAARDIRKGSTSMLVRLSKADWDSREISWEFAYSSLLEGSSVAGQNTSRIDPLSVRDYQRGSTFRSLEKAYQSFTERWQDVFLKVVEIEEKNNHDYITAHGMQETVGPQVSYTEITILEDELDSHDRDRGRITFKKQEVLQQLVSYGVGCIFGRYSLNKAGLVLANAGDDIDAYLAQVPEPTLRPDESGILPITDDNDFTDDLPSQWRAFLRAAFGDEHYDENLRFLEDGLGKHLRPYFLKGFYDDHVKRYKKRPIYWLITSPKGTLQALIYLHRYNRDTVNRFLNDYLRPYQQKLEAKRVSAEHVLTGGGTSQSEKTKAQKRIDEIRKAQEELSTWERDVVRPLAEKRIELDLDDGVKVNYGKLGAILAKVKGLNG